jgi:atypical dual specificity phosphatase
MDTTKPVFVTFPRTDHLINLGSASSDDLISTEEKRKSFFTKLPGKVYTIEEKIDGSNLGIFYNPETDKVVFQNRSNILNFKALPEEHETLNKWAFKNEAVLKEILGEDNIILYGEWMYAKHAIKYDKLPGLFVAFDIYDRTQNKFYSRERFWARMKDTGIPVVPVVSQNFADIATEEMIKKTIKRKSTYTDDWIEGIYVRIDNDDGWLMSRAKVVKAGFVAGDENWNKGITKNILAEGDKK